LSPRNSITRCGAERCDYFPHIDDFWLAACLAASKTFS
jgi:hypothetical protein